MGVCGCGKTSVGTELARKFGSDGLFIDADDFHPQKNKDKMASGQPLTDEDRIPWLINIHETIITQAKNKRVIVLACSALKKSYRKIIKSGNSDTPVMKVSKVFLNGSAETIQQRLATRKNHFMNPNLLKSQFDTLEPPKNAFVVDIDTLSVSEIVELLFTYSKDDKSNKVNI